MDFKFVDIGSKEHEAGLLVREQLFFKNFTNASELLNDVYEKESVHLVALENNIVIGTGRLTVINNTAIISQMTVLPAFQKQNVGKRILQLLIDKSINTNCSIIELSARTIALEFYKKYGFITTGDVYPSKKTGVLHQKMILNTSK